MPTFRPPTRRCLARLAYRKVTQRTGAATGPAHRDGPSIGLVCGTDKEPWLRNRYIVLPNVTDGGYQTLLRSKMSHKYREMPCVGGYLDGTVEKKVGEGNRRILDGLNSDYGNKRLALIQTSDSRTGTFADLGKHSTWIKWSVPTAEALRQACLAQEFAHLADNARASDSLGLEIERRQQHVPWANRPRVQPRVQCHYRWSRYRQIYLSTTYAGHCATWPISAGDEEVGDPAVRRQRLISTTLAPLTRRSRFISRSTRSRTSSEGVRSPETYLSRLVMPNLSRHVRPRYGNCFLFKHIRRSN